MKQFLINFCSIIFDLFVIINTAIIWNITIFSIALGEVIMFNSIKTINTTIISYF